MAHRSDLKFELAFIFDPKEVKEWGEPRTVERDIVDWTAIHWVKNQIESAVGLSFESMNVDCPTKKDLPVVKLYDVPLDKLEKAVLSIEQLALFCQWVKVKGDD